MEMDKCTKCGKPLTGNHQEKLCVSCRFVPNCPICGVKNVGCGRLMISAQDPQARHCRCPRNNIPIASMSSIDPRAARRPSRKPLPKWTRNAALTKIPRDQKNAERTIARDDRGKSNPNAQANGATALEQKENVADDQEPKPEPEEIEVDDEDTEHEREQARGHKKSSSDDDQPPSPGLAPSTCLYAEYFTS